MTSTTRTIKLGKDITVALRFGPRREWQGIGAVTVNGVALRDGAQPLLVRLDTPDGYLYTRYVLEKITRQKGGAVAVRFRAFGYPWGRQEYMDEYEQPLYNLGLGATAVEDTLVLNLAPAKLELGGRQWRGFSYSFAFHSDTRQIHRLLVHGSWELGGSIVGNTVLSQGQCNRPVYRGEKDTLFTTTCLKALHLYGSPQGVSFQLAPRGGLLQAFDFQFGRPGALFQYWPRFDSIASVSESPAGSTRLQVVDEYRFPRTRQAATTPQQVLFTPGPLAEHEARDLWWEATRFVTGGIRRRYGVLDAVVRPELARIYTTRLEADRLLMTIGGVEVPSEEVPYAIAAHVLPQLARIGIRRFWPEVMLHSDVTELGLKRKLETGIHGGLVCASVCAIHRVFPSEFWGGIKGWKHMADRAHALGMEIGSWFPSHFSPNAAIFREHPEWRVIGPNSLSFGGGYGNVVINSVDWNSGFTDWVLADVRRWKEEAGLDYLWADSFSNLGLLMPNYAAGMRTNLAGLGRLYGELTKLGLKSFSFESVSPFGIMGCGLADLGGAKIEPNRAVAGQNDFGWWVGEEDMAFNACFFAVETPQRRAAELRRIQFRMMANRGFVMLHSLISGNYHIPAWWVRLNQTYEQALPHMKTRRLLPDRAGVRWQNGHTEILWAYRAQAIPVKRGAQVAELLGPAAREIKHQGTLAARGGAVYRIRD